MLDKKIAFIGSGAMGEAIIAGLLRQGISRPEELLIADPRAERVQELHEKYGVQPFTENIQAVAEADVVVLSVKPQMLSKVMQGLKGLLHADVLVLSIIAGAKVSKISKGLAHLAVVRSMPNTPAQISQGITGWYAAPAVSDAQRETAKSILGALGKQVLVDEESYLDMVTAVSGSGPAYVFLFMEAMIDAAVHLGFARPVAEQLVLETIKGSVAYYEAQNGKTHLAALRNQVTSPGGTTAEAISQLEEAGFRSGISRAMRAAHQRSVELGKDAPDEH